MNTTHHNPFKIWAYTTRRHLLIDLDDCGEDKAIRVAKLIMAHWHKVGDCLLVKSSPKKHETVIKFDSKLLPYIKTRRDNYHLIFNNDIGYNLCCKICETLAGLGILNKGYSQIRSFRGDMTLRVSTEARIGWVKESPSIIRGIPNNYTDRADGMIRDYLDWYFTVNKYQGLTSLDSGEHDLNPDQCAEYNY